MQTKENKNKNTHRIRFHDRRQGATCSAFSLCLNTPRTPCRSPDVISDLQALRCMRAKGFWFNLELQADQRSRRAVRERAGVSQTWGRRPCTTMRLNGNAAQHQHRGTLTHSLTHLWRELYYKLPPSAAVPMRTEKAKAKSDGQVIESGTERRESGSHALFILTLVATRTCSQVFLDCLFSPDWSETG